MKMKEQTTKYINEIETLKYSWNYMGAREQIEKSLLKHTDDYRLYEELADIYLYEGNFKKAENAMKYAQKLHPESATGTYLMGYIYLSKWDFSLWVELLLKANELFPNNAEILRNLGWWYNMLGQTGKWIMLLKRALNLSPEDKLIMEDLWVALIWNWDVDLWEFYLKKAGKENKIFELKTLMNL